MKPQPKYVTVGNVLPEPMQGRPVEQPIRGEDGVAPRRVEVHRELGVPIFFNPATREFNARVGVVQGRGAASELHSQDFGLVVERIRERALVVPVQGFLVSINHYAGPEEQVQVLPCTVIEYHPRRFQPFVIRVTEPQRPNPHAEPEEERPAVERIRPANMVLLPEPEHIERVRAAHRAALEEETRHDEARRRLQDELRAALDAIPQLTARDVKYVQESRRQVAQEAEGLGAVTFDQVTDEDEDDEPSEEETA